MPGRTEQAVLAVLERLEAEGVPARDLQAIAVGMYAVLDAQRATRTERARAMEGDEEYQQRRREVNRRWRHVPENRERERLRSATRMTGSEYRERMKAYQREWAARQRAKRNASPEWQERQREKELARDPSRLRERRIAYEAEYWSRPENAGRRRLNAEARRQILAQDPEWRERNREYRREWESRPENKERRLKRQREATKVRRVVDSEFKQKEAEWNRRSKERAKARRNADPELAAAYRAEQARAARVRRAKARGDAGER